MSASSNKVFIQVESDETQQENLKNSRRTFKVLQKNAQDKENLAGRIIVASGKESLLKQKAEFEEEKTVPKKRKPSTASQHVQTDSEESCDQLISESDLTSTAGPSQKYWEILAEKRRVALEEALKENEALHTKVATLTDELKVSREMLAETEHLVATLTEMLEENEGEEKDEAKEATEESPGSE